MCAPTYPCGQFRMATPATAHSRDERVDLAQWRARGADTLVVGSVAHLADGRSTYGSVSTTT